jgi:cytochrome c peroxidase
MMSLKHLGVFALAAFMVFGAMALPVVVQASPPLTDDLQILGRELFFDKNLSTPPGQSCASCHDPKAGFADPDVDQPVSQGVIRPRFGSRNTPSASYAAFSPALHWDPRMSQANMMKGMYVGGLFWDGRADTLEEQALQPFLNILEMHNMNHKQVVLAIRQSSYAYLFRLVFGADALNDVEKAFEYAGEAIAAYERSTEVNPFTSKYDHASVGLVELSEAEARGLALFTGKANCHNCHTATPDPVAGKPLFTNFGHQNLGTPANPDNPFYNLPRKFNPDGKNYVDLGLGKVLEERGDPNKDVVNASAQKQKGMFKIPSLRNVAVTPPYEHNGVFKTLREVVMFNNTRDVPGAGWPPPEVPENVHRHMSMGGMGSGMGMGMEPPPVFFGDLKLTDQEVDDIVAFLETLTDGYEVPESPAP